MQDSPLVARVRDNLRRFERLELPREGRRVAAVAIALVDDPVESFLLTRRPLDARRHAGQFALPGGMGEDGETAEQTARRELAEELGVSVDSGAVIGTLDDYATRSGFVITPIVLWCGAVPELIPDPREVAAAYRIPVESLLDDDVVEEHESEEPDHPILSLRLADTRVYAPTAAMILQFKEVGLCGRPRRAGHFGEPRFAWK